MTIFTRVMTVCLAAVVFIPSSFVSAQESMSDDSMVPRIFSDERTSEEMSGDSMSGGVKQKIDALPTAGDAVKGVVKENSNKEYYDIYGRQLAFRENAKKFRKSLEERRKAAEVPRLQAIKRYRNVAEEVYSEETAIYQEEIGGTKSPKMMDMQDYGMESDAQQMDSDSMTGRKTEMMDGDVRMKNGKTEMLDGDVEMRGGKTEMEKPLSDDDSLKKEMLPTAGGSVSPRRRVVTSPDAPYFDASNM